MKTDNKFHRDGKGGYVGCFETTLDGTPAVVTFETVKGQRGGSREAYWATTATVGGRHAIQSGGRYYGLAAVICNGFTKRQATNVAALAKRGFVTDGDYARLRLPGDPYSR